jgi:hypothetical protein
MGRIITICNARDFSAANHKEASSKEMKVGPVSIKFITIVIICLLSLFYLAQSQKTAIRAYQIKSLQDQKDLILQQNEELQVNDAKLKSIENIQSEVGILQLVPSGAATYLDSQQQH